MQQSLHKAKVNANISGATFNGLDVHGNAYFPKWLFLSKNLGN